MYIGVTSKDLSCFKQFKERNFAALSVLCVSVGISVLIFLGMILVIQYVWSLGPLFAFFHEVITHKKLFVIQIFKFLYFLFVFFSPLLVIAWKMILNIKFFYGKSAPRISTKSYSQIFLLNNSKLTMLMRNSC